MKLNWRKKDKYFWEGYGESGMIVCTVQAFGDDTARLYRKEPDQQQFDFISPEHAREWANNWYEAHMYE